MVRGPPRQFGMKDLVGVFIFCGQETSILKDRLPQNPVRSTNSAPQHRVLIRV